MQPPFTQAEFFALFGQYNDGVWPLIIFFYMMAIASIALLFRPDRIGTLFVACVLCAMWVANGAGYHWLFFREINPAAPLFGMVFLLQAALLFLLPLRNADFRFAVASDARSVAGLFLIVFATVIYPIWGWRAGQAWREMPAFGVAPCPTTIYTIGVLLTGPWRVVRWLLIVPGIWAGFGGSAALLLGVTQDLALFAALALVFVFAVARVSGMPFGWRAEGNVRRHRRSRERAD